jgi:hypothetical protein
MHKRSICLTHQKLATCLCDQAGTCMHVVLAAFVLAIKAEFEIERKDAFQFTVQNFRFG